MKPVAFSTFALVLLLALAACNKAPQADYQADAGDHSAQTTKEGGETAPSAIIARKIDKAVQKAKQELTTRNIDVNSIHVVHFGNHGQDRHDSRPKAEITPQGDLLIASKKVATTPAQQILLLDYRKQIVGIAEAGMDIGVEGADIGIQAAKTALWGAFTGNTDKDTEAAIKPQTDRIHAAALALCQRLPALLSSQQKLAAAMSEFRPYATMQQEDVDDCGKHSTDKAGKKGFAVFAY
ncbi:MAG: hypothetical protein ABIU96_14945 [Rhodanobacter sp.]